MLITDTCFITAWSIKVIIVQTIGAASKLAISWILRSNLKKHLFAVLVHLEFPYKLLFWEIFPHSLLCRCHHFRIDTSQWLVLLTRDKLQQVNRCQWSRRSSFIHWKLVEYIVSDYTKGTVLYLGRQYSKGILSHSSNYSTKTAKNTENLKSGIITNIYSFSGGFYPEWPSLNMNRNKRITLYFRQSRDLNSQASP